jgi:hypothetical protein
VKWPRKTPERRQSTGGGAAALVRQVLAGDQPLDAPGTPRTWKEIVRLSMTSRGAASLPDDSPEYRYYKLLVSRGLKALDEFGEIERVGDGYRLDSEVESIPQRLHALRNRIDFLEMTLYPERGVDARPGIAPTHQGTVKPGVFLPSMWYLVRDAFKDVGLGVERELARRGTRVEKPTRFRVTKGRPSERCVEVSFLTISPEAKRIPRREMARAWATPFPPVRPRSRRGRLTRSAAPAGLPSIRSK